MGNKTLFIMGASGHGEVIYDLASSLKCYENIIFLDDDKLLQERMVVQGGKEYALQYSDCAEVIVAVGNAEIRKMLVEYYKEHDVIVTSLVHPFSWVAPGTVIEDGTVIMAGAVVQPGCKIGKGVIINTSSSVDHDCMIGDYCHISVGSHLAGSVCLGDNTWIGAGATINNNINICSNVMIGAGAVVVKDITEPGTYVGVPAKKLMNQK